MRLVCIHNFCAVTLCSATSFYFVYAGATFLSLAKMVHFVLAGKTNELFARVQTKVVVSVRSIADAINVNTGISQHVYQHHSPRE